MEIVALGDGAFVSAFRLSGVKGIVVDDPDQTVNRLDQLVGRGDVGLILISDKISKPIRNRVNLIKSERAIPLIYEVPAPGSNFEKIAYREMLKQILGV
jgi:V/A-type H+-transporting ATPase subunit F